ncbi:glycosyltransferase family 39 protein [Trichocoleus desertorum]|uniref:glycosyltransferase family 39 protein n=1 Tax=Trichocoleus desertorum TaxID=1481672 RepID=UPI00168613D2
MPIREAASSPTSTYLRKGKGQVRSWQSLSTTFELLLNYRVAGSFFVLLCACYFVFFWHLDALSLRTYDEARRAVNALEMSLNGNFIVSYFDGQPDLWGTKPPLLLWLIVACMKVFGYNEFAVRLPSAIAATTTVLTLFLFSTFYLQSLVVGITSAFVLMTSYGYVAEHVARTGDYDALLTLWITVYSLTYFVYIHASSSKKPWYLWLTAIAIMLAMWTKGIAALIPLLGLFVYTIYQKRLGQLLRSPSFYSSAIFVIGAGLSYYLLREYYNPGYLEAMLSNEVGRYSESVEGHTGDFWFYLQQMQRTFIPWLYLLLPSLVVAQISQKRLIKALGAFCGFYLICHFLVVSSSQTKLAWYNAPQYPIAALLIGLGVSEACHWLIKYLRINPRSKQQLIAGLFVCALLFLPSLRMARKVSGTYVYSRPHDPPEVQLGYYLRRLQKTQPELTTFQVVDMAKGTVGGRRAHTLFYVKAADLDPKYAIALSTPEQTVPNNQVVVTCIPAIKTQLVAQYQLSTIDTKGACSALIVKQAKAS